MGKVDVDTLKKQVSDFTLSQDLLNNILDNIQKCIIENGNLITDANKEDVKISKKQIKIKKLLEIVEVYRTQKYTSNKKDRIVAIYRGDPYLTLHLSLQALINHTKVILMCDEFMVGVNNIIIKILLNIFKKNKIENLVSYNNEYDFEDFDKIYEISNNVIVIGNTLVYQKIKQLKKKAKFYPYNNILLYCDSDELLKLQDAIYIYANENQYELEILSLKSIKEVLERIETNKFINTVVLLTKSNSHKELVENSIKDKDIFVNDNPFKQEVGRIYNYFK